ncbi:MAG: coiled-coil domain-containing protein [Candidatus Odinarchaeia archaeon]
MESIKLTELEDYLIKKSEKKLKNIRKKAESDKNKILELIDKIRNSADKFLHSKDRELFKDLSSDTKKHELAVKAADKLNEGIIEGLNSIVIPETIKYEDMVKLLETIKTFFNKLNKLGRKWVPRMSPWFKQELKEFDYYLRKLVGIIQKLDDFVFRDFKIVDKFDKTIELIKSLSLSLEEKNMLEKLITQLEQEIDQIESTLSKEKKKLDDFKSSGIQKELKDAMEELQLTRRAFNMTINPIIKPLKKFSKSPSNAKAILTTKQRDLIDEYIANPFETFLSENENLDDIKNILKALKQSLENNELELKKSRIDKAIKQIKKITKEKTLEEIHSKAKNITGLIDKLKKELGESGIIEKREGMKSTIHEINDSLSDKKVELDHAKTDYANLCDKIERDKVILIEKIRDLLGEEINITLN